MPALFVTAELQIQQRNFGLQWQTYIPTTTCRRVKTAFRLLLEKPCLETRGGEVVKSGGQYERGHESGEDDGEAHFCVFVESGCARYELQTRIDDFDIVRDLDHEMWLYILRGSFVVLAD